MTEPTKQTEMNTEKSNNNTIDVPKKRKRKVKIDVPLKVVVKN